MKIFALAAFLAVACTSFSPTAMAAPEAGRKELVTAVTAHYDLDAPETLKGYEKTSMGGFTTVYVLVERTSADQPGTLIFDGQKRLIAFSFSRPSDDGVTVMDTEAMDFWHVPADAYVAAR